MTIKKRIVIWYTVWMALLVGIAAAVLFSASGALLRRELIEELEEAIYDAAEDIMVMGDEVRFDDDLDFFDDGIYISIWNGDRMIAGRFPEEAPVSQAADGMLQEASNEDGGWYIMDAALSGPFYVRGASRSYDMNLIASSMQMLLVILLPAIVVLAAAGGYFIVRRSFRPADRVIATAGDIAGSDDLSKRIGLGPGEDEIHQMAAAFDSMMDRIEGAFEREKQFTSDASHELRTPIAVIRAEAEYASSHTDDPAVTGESLAVISAQAGRMSKLVSELLAMARAEKGTLRPDPELFDLSELGEMVIDSLWDKAEERHITLNMKAPEHLELMADHGMMTRILINLVSNAIAYGRDGGWVLLRLSCSDGAALIEVEDNGIGIASEHIGRIWERFYQVDAARTHEASSGSGLGLSIVRTLAEAQGGTAEAESVEGQGSTFRVRIPLHADDGRSVLR